MTAPHSSRRAPPLILYFLPCLFLFYTLSSNRVVSGNDGSHFAFVMAMAEEGTFSINNQMHVTKFDHAKVGEKFYTDRPPGAGFMAYPFARLGLLLIKIYPGMTVLYPPASYVVILPALWGALAALLLFLLLRQLGCRDAGALGAALLFALGTMQWKYSTALYSHGIAAAFVLLAAWLLARARHGGGEPRKGALIAAGLALGFLPALEYVAALLIAPLGLYALLGLWERRPGGKSRNSGELRHLNDHNTGELRHPRPAPWIAARAGAMALGGLIGLAPLLYYNWVCFGHPFNHSYKFHATFDWSRSFSETFNGPWLRGFYGLMWDRGTHGLLFMSPVLFLALAGFALGWRRRAVRIELAGALALFFGYAVFMAKHRTFYGGGTMDYRYILFIVPMLMIGMGFYVDAVWPVRRPAWEDGPWRRWARAQGFLLLAGLGALSFGRMVKNLLDFFGHEHLRRPAAELPNSLLLIENRLFALFPGVTQLWLFMAALAVFSAIGVAGMWLAASRECQRQRQST